MAESAATRTLFQPSASERGEEAELAKAEQIGKEHAKDDDSGSVSKRHP